MMENVWDAERFFGLAHEVVESVAGFEEVDELASEEN